MKTADWNSLQDKIVRPDIDKHLVPLLLYRGSNGMGALGRMSRLWNFAITMMEHEVETYGQAVKLAQNPDYAHLCGPRRPMQMSAFPGLFGRLADNPNVTDNIKGLTDYVRLIKGSKYKLTPISIYTNQAPREDGRFAPWRIQGFSPEVQAAREKRKYERQEITRLKMEARAEERRQARLRRLADNLVEPMFYPYLMHKPRAADPGTELVMAVHDAVPEYLPPHIREDVCQDLIVALLAGEISRADLEDEVSAYVNKVFKMHPTKYGPLSLDAIIPGTEDMRLIDTIPSDAEHF